MEQKERIELRVGDIVAQPDLSAIVNAANAELQIGGGVAGAIHSKGDPELEEETRPLAPIQPGQAVITSAPNLPNDYVIHCLGPRYGIDQPEERLLGDCYQTALKLAAEREIESIGFPAISTGAFGYPPEDAVKVATSTTQRWLNAHEFPRKVCFVLFDEETRALYQRRTGSGLNLHSKDGGWTCRRMKRWQGGEAEWIQPSSRFRQRRQRFIPSANPRQAKDGGPLVPEQTRPMMIEVIGGRYQSVSSLSSFGSTVTSRTASLPSRRKHTV